MLELIVKMYLKCLFKPALILNTLLIEDFARFIEQDLLE